MLAAAVLTGPAVYPAAAGDRNTDLLTVLGALGVGLLLAGTAFRLAEAVPAALVLVGAEYAIFLALRGDAGLDTSAPLMAGAFVLAAEIAHSAVEPPLAAAPATLRALRAARPIALGAGSVGVGALLLYLSVAEVGSGLLLEILGVAAAATTLALVAMLARRA